VCVEARPKEKFPTKKKSFFLFSSRDSHEQNGELVISTRSCVHEIETKKE
jgi:hypothetical protein